MTQKLNETSYIGSDANLKVQRTVRWKPDDALWCENNVGGEGYNQIYTTKKPYTLWCSMNESFARK